MCAVIVNCTSNQAAAGAALQFGFTKCSLDKIIGLTHPDNLASRRVLEKCELRLIDRKDYWGMEMCRHWIERCFFHADI